MGVVLGSLLTGVLLSFIIVFFVSGMVAFIQDLSDFITIKRLLKEVL